VLALRKQVFHRCRRARVLDKARRRAGMTEEKGSLGAPFSGPALALSDAPADILLT